MTRTGANFSIGSPLLGELIDKKAGFRPTVTEVCYNLQVRPQSAVLPSDESRGGAVVSRSIEI